MLTRSIKVSLNALIFFVLAVLTQVGALTYLLVLALGHIYKLENRAIKFVLNIGFYLVCTFFIVPFVAPIFGRVPISINDHLKPVNYWVSVGLNRHYVVPELNVLLQGLSHDLAEQSPNTVLYFLDANFPFLDRYPLLPHLSHNDGRKVDLSYMYVDQNGQLTNLRPSNSGYGYFENPKNGEYDTNAFCKTEGYFQYDYPKYLTLGHPNRNIDFSEEWNRLLVKMLLSNGNVKKVFIEPHLVERLELKDPRLRFHGCRAVRHDDHIHFQI